MLKRAFDVVFSGILLVALSPVMALVWIALRSSGIEPIFRQERPGYRTKTFAVVKFRTMRDGAGSDGARLTRLGTFLRRNSLDELPQLWNILKGDLSFVGPRPLLMRYLPHYTPRQMRRHDVTPGVTGWAQVHGRNLVAWTDRFELDLFYVEHRSFWLDMRILLLTAKRVFTRHGVLPDANVLLDDFGD